MSLTRNQGGGVPYRQGPHQIDTLRLLGGGLVKSVRAVTGDMVKSAAYPGLLLSALRVREWRIGEHRSRWLRLFPDPRAGAVGDGVAQRYTADERVKIRKTLYDGTRNEYEDKNDLRIGGRAEEAVFRSSGPTEWLPSDLGIVVVSCERGDIRHSAYGVWVYSDEGRREIRLDEVQGVVGRRAEILELYNSIANNTPVYHSGRWGLATLECCMAVLDSGREHKEIQLKHQVAAQDDYDADFVLPS